MTNDVSARLDHKAALGGSTVDEPAAEPQAASAYYPLHRKYDLEVCPRSSIELNSITLGEFEGISLDEKEILAEILRIKSGPTPIYVRANGNTSILVFGHLTLVAMIREGRTSANAVVVDKLPTEIVRFQACRKQEQMDPFMEAKMLAVLKDRYGYTDSVLAARMGCSRVTIAQRRAVAELPVEIETEARQLGNKVSRSALIELAQLKNVVLVKEIWAEAMKSGGLTLKAFRELRSPGGGGTRLALYKHGTKLVETLQHLTSEGGDQEASSLAGQIITLIAKLFELCKKDCPRTTS